MIAMLVLSFQFLAASSASVGDGHCDPRLNYELHQWDGGDCCLQTCTKGCYGATMESCLNPAFKCPVPFSKRHWISDGFCDGAYNTEQCGYDGGDCCKETCQNTFYHTCSLNYQGESDGCADPAVNGCSGDHIRLQWPLCQTNCDNTDTSSCVPQAGPLCMCPEGTVWANYETREEDPWCIQADECLDSPALKGDLIFKRFASPCVKTCNNQDEFCIQPVAPGYECPASDPIWINYDKQDEAPHCGTIDECGPIDDCSRVECQSPDSLTCDKDQYLYQAEGDCCFACHDEEPPNANPCEIPSSMGTIIIDCPMPEPCQDGHYYAEEGECCATCHACPKEGCGSGEHIQKQCASSPTCAKTCDEPLGPHCIELCVLDGFECPQGLPIWLNKYDDGAAPDCGTFSECPACANEVCEDLENQCQGYWYTREGECCPSCESLPRGGQGDLEFKTWGSSCVKTCENRFDFCTAQAVPDVYQCPTATPIWSNHQALESPHCIADADCPAIENRGDQILKRFAKPSCLQTCDDPFPDCLPDAEETLDYECPEHNPVWLNYDSDEEPICGTVSQC